jgi:hypothetical protein
VPFIPAGGYDAPAVRIEEARAALRRAVPTTVLHLSDLDRHGGRIIHVLRRDLPDLYRDMGGLAAPEVVKIALTEEQAQEVYPGRDSWRDIQVDAVPTPTPQGIVAGAITSRLDTSVLGTVLERERPSAASCRPC